MAADEVLHGCRQPCREVSACRHNERNPRVSCQRQSQALWTDCRRKPREGGMTSNQHAPYVRGRHTCYNGVEQREATWRRERNPKTRLSSDWSLQLDSMKLDSLVIAHQPWRGEYVPGPCTPPVKPWERECTKAVTARRSRVRLVTGAKS